MNILYEDDSLQIIDKPPGLAVTEIPGMPAHRLDKDTSGVMLLAKGPEALENLQAQFKARTVKKEYLALVHGTVEEAGKIEGAVGRNPAKPEKFSVLLNGKHAETEYEPISNFEFRISNFETIFAEFNKIQKNKLQKMNYGRFTLLRCFPRTGRTHQIRVHLKYVNHPIAADDKYAGRKMNRLDRRWCPRMFLHASKIGFKHPAKGEWMEIESKLPEDLKKALWTAFSYNWP